VYDTGWHVVLLPCDHCMHFLVAIAMLPPSVRLLSVLQQAQQRAPADCLVASAILPPSVRLLSVLQQAQQCAPAAAGHTDLLHILFQSW
jgi:hypothetical protein